MIDVVVVGGGPIGLATALYLDRAGLQVCVLEQRPGPIDKACGEGLMPQAVRALRALGVQPAGRDFTGIRYLDGSREVCARFASGPGRGVRRTELHAALTATVAARGIPVEQRRVTEVEQDAGRVTVNGLAARYLVAADGLHSAIRHQLGLARDTRRSPRWGQRRHFELEPWTDVVEVHWSRFGEAYVTPTGDGLVGVAVLSSRREPFEQQLQHFPRLQQRLACAQGNQVRGAGPLRQRVSRRVAGRILLVGDAAGYVDALTGEGLSIGLQAAERLTSCLAADRPDDYERAWRQATRRYRVLTESLVLAAGNRATRPLIVPAAYRLPGVFGAVVSALAS